jgi:hypothetical protein
MNDEIAPSALQLTAKAIMAAAPTQVMSRPPGEEIRG